ncbi:MAG: helix-turn-helix domain-containing protein [bacterium]|nr:helix-turn-helix domain-containing protein [bacterium]
MSQDKRESPLHDVVANLLVGTGQIAFALGVSRTTVVRMANDGRLTHAYRTPAGAFRFRIKHLVEYLDGGLGDKVTG